MHPLLTLFMDQANTQSIAADQQLIVRLRTDDRRAWQQVYKQTGSKVVYYLRRHKAPEDVAHSIFQETLIILDQRKAALTLTCKLSVFLIGIAILKLKEYWRKQGKDPEQLTDDFSGLDRKLVEDDVDASQLALLELAFMDDASLLDDTATPEELVQHALTRLSDKCVSLFRMRFWEGLDDYQIAAAVPMEYRLVRDQIYKCKARMRSIISELRK